MIDTDLVELYTHCVLCIDRYRSDSGGYPPDTFVEHYFDDMDLEKNKKDMEFISELIVGLERYENFINTTLDLFAKRSSAEEFLILNREKTDYSVVLYMLYFIFPEKATFAFLKLFFSNALVPVKRQRFIQFIFNSDIIAEKCVDEWSKHYEIAWIEAEIISSVKENQGTVLDYAATLVDKSKPQRKADTVMEPFNLTEQKPKTLPVEEVIDFKFKTKEVPATTYQPEHPGIAKALDMYREGKRVPFLDEKVLEKNRNEMNKLREEMEKSKLNNSTLFQKKKKDAEEFAKKYEETIPSPKFVVKDIEQVRKILDAPANVKLNAAAILREEAIVRKKQGKEAELLKKYETELRDDSEFVNWKESMKLMDEKKQLEDIERKKREAMESDLNARLMKEQFAEKNTIIASEQKKKREADVNALKEKLVTYQKMQEEKNKEFAKAREEKLKEVKKEIKIEKKRTAYEVKKQREVNEKIIKKQQEEEQKKREELMKQIKALVSGSKRQTKTFDRTETSEVGLLAEMSIQQLKEELDGLKKKQEQEREEKKSQIISQKKEKENDMQAKLSLLRKHREQTKKERTTNRMKKIETMETQNKQAEEMRREGMIALSEKIEQKRDLKMKELKQQAELKNQRLKEKQRLHQEKENVEKKHWENQEIGAERECLIRFENQKRSAPVRNRSKKIGLYKTSDNITEAIHHEEETPINEEVEDHPEDTTHNTSAAEIN
ncbi:predicted protein [Naegleria gruberi]|uniref:Predicted protein n=1 Tax=Naegleria gruberi TaxID=5762 RepID=D2VM04_NAEGR|nr:uncharacterized protein NAEGRDRAFT_50666 [Naegleria gruberi]EFC42143.1 predicted protein [Naegleria gruberi]|eukprot:XP_002674887.1 predicted protein [Naegleria gruberi strain NEG-M]